ncbi:MAG: hypothetical protein JSV36_12305 [Anaerolineae bacterium]|nr:MAG: hypothetical protein JSV36_12305 [Anaerolineae bacterium]
MIRTQATQTCTGSDRWLLLVLLLAFLSTLVVQYPSLKDPYRIDDDFRQYYWMNWFRDHDLFPRDPLMQSVKGVHFLRVGNWEIAVQYYSLGFSLIYLVGSLLLDPLWVNKLLPFGLAIVATWYSYRLGQRLKDTRTGVLTAMLFILYIFVAPANVALSPGLERSFALPMLIVFWYYMIADDKTKVVLVLVIAMLIYAPTFFLCASAYALSFIQVKDRRVTIELERSRVLTLALGLLLGTLVFMPTLADDWRLPDQTASVEPVGVFHNPRFRSTGRVPIFWEHPSGLPVYLLIGDGGLVGVPSEVVALMPLVFLLLLMLAVGGLGALKLPPKLGTLLAAALLMWAMAWAIAMVTSLFVLKFPSKYTRAALPLFLLLLVASNAEAFVNRCIVLLSQKKAVPALLLACGGALVTSLGLFILSGEGLYVPAFPSAKGSAFGRTLVAIGGTSLWIGIALTGRHRLGQVQDLPLLGRADRMAEAAAQPPSPRITLKGLTFLVAALAIVYLPHWTGRTIRVTPERRELYDFIATLPKDALLAAPPSEAANIPLFARRSVLFSDEILPFKPETVIDFFDGYYATSATRILSFCRQYGVNYLVVDRTSFSSQTLAENRFFFEPYNSDIVAIVGQRKDFVLDRLPNNAKLFQGETLFVVTCEEGTFAGFD